MVFTQDANSSLGGLPLDHIQLLIGVWADRYTALGALDHVQYVLPFEATSVLILMAIVGALLLAKRETQQDAQRSLDAQREQEL